MSCEEFDRLLDNYENLTDEEKIELNEHAMNCERCSEELTFFLSMISTAKSLPQIEVPEDFMTGLNARLDIEDKKANTNRLINHLRRNWRQYTSIAAGIALVVTLTANRGILFDRMKGTEDGVITEANTKDGGGAAQNGTTEQGGRTENNNNSDLTDNLEGEKIALGGESKGSPISEEIASVSRVRNVSPSKSYAGRSYSFSPEQTDSDFSEEYYEMSISNQSDMTVDTETRESNGKETDSKTKENGKTKENNGREKESDYGIALAGVMNTAMETAYVDYDLKPEELTASLKANKVMDGYSLADGNGETIAMGRYYSIDRNGRPIMEQSENTAKAVGSLKISSDDEETVRSVLEQYPHDEKGDVYTTGSETVNQILTDLNDVGVEYTDYIVGGSDDVKFTVDVDR